MKNKTLLRNRQDKIEINYMMYKRNKNKFENKYELVAIARLTDDKKWVGYRYYASPEIINNLF